jgi:hypothetical protein
MRCAKIWYSNRQLGDDNIKQRMHGMLGNSGYRHTLRICNTLLFHGNHGYANAPQCNVYACIASVFFGAQRKRN